MIDDTTSIKLTLTHPQVVPKTIRIYFLLTITLVSINLCSIKRL